MTNLLKHKANESSAGAEYCEFCIDSCVFCFGSAGKIPNIDSDNAKEYKWSKTSNAFTFGSNETGQLGFAVTTDDVDGIYEQVTIPEKSAQDR